MFYYVNFCKAEADWSIIHVENRRTNQIVPLILLTCQCKISLLGHGDERKIFQAKKEINF